MTLMTAFLCMLSMLCKYKRNNNNKIIYLIQNKIEHNEKNMYEKDGAAAAVTAPEVCLIDG